MLSREEEAYQEGILRRFRGKLEEKLEKEILDDKNARLLAVEDKLVIARRRLPRRLEAEGLYWTLKAKIGRLSNNFQSLLTTVEDGVIPPDTQAWTNLFIRKWDEDLHPKILDVRARLESSYYGYNKFNNNLVNQLDQDMDDVFMSMGPLRHENKTRPVKVPPPAPAPAAECRWS